MNTLTILVKPSSEKCNLQCHYCFYHDISAKREVKDYGFMSDDIAKAIIDNAFQGNNYDCIHFAFQGGEPTLIGLPFFVKFVKYVQAKLALSNKQVQYSLQTNGTPLNQSWFNFFKLHDFLIGLSLDGDQWVHDKYRIYSTQKGSYNKVVSVLEKLKQQSIRFNILSVVTSQLARRIQRIYHELKTLGAQHLQFIPCLEPWHSPGKILAEKPSEWTLSTQDYGHFLSNLFQLWQADIYTENAPEIRYFNNLLGIMFGYLPESCDMRGTCAIQNVVEADGSIYPCDFYAFESMKIGHVTKQSFEQLHTQEEAQQFLSRSHTLPSDCKQCAFVQLCRTGCHRHNETEQAGSKNRFCQSYLFFFNQHIREIETIAQHLHELD